MKKDNTIRLHFPMMLEARNFFVIVQKRGGDIFVTCPFQSCSTGFVDFLDMMLLRHIKLGVVQYLRVDDFLTSVQISEAGKLDDVEALRVVAEAMCVLDNKVVNYGQETIERMRSFKDFLLNAELVPCDKYSKWL